MDDEDNNSHGLGRQGWSAVTLRSAIMSPAHVIVTLQDWSCLEDPSPSGSSLRREPRGLDRGGLDQPQSRWRSPQRVRLPARVFSSERQSCDPRLDLRRVRRIHGLGRALRRAVLPVSARARPSSLTCITDRTPLLRLRYEMDPNSKSWRALDPELPESVHLPLLPAPDSG